MGIQSAGEADGTRVLRWIQLVDVVLRERFDATAGPEIVRFDVRVRRQELDFAPCPPAALMAPVRLPVRKFLAQPFETIP